MLYHLYKLYVVCLWGGDVIYYFCIYANDESTDFT